MLYLLWCAATRRPLDAEGVAGADRRIAAWRMSVVEPLRAARRATKAGLLPGVSTSECRERLKAVELESERLAQVALYAEAPPPVDASCFNGSAEIFLALYAAHLDRALPPDHVRVVLDAATA